MAKYGLSHPLHVYDFNLMNSTVVRGFFNGGIFLRHVKFWK